jgi:hypothetical protein
MREGKEGEREDCDDDDDERRNIPKLYPSPKR